MSSLIRADTSLKVQEFLTEDMLRSLHEEHGANAFKAGYRGGSYPRTCLRKVDINAQWDELHIKSKTSTSVAVKKKLAKRLKVH